MANISEINGYLINAESASYALTASFALNGGGGAAFPYTGSAIITGSLIVTGSTTSTLGFTGSLFGTASYATQALTASFVNPLNQNVTISGSLLVSSSIVGSGSTYNTTIDLQSATISTNGTASIAYGVKYLFDNKNVRSIVWDARQLLDNSQSLSVNYNSRTLNSGSTTVLDWSSGVGLLIGTSSWAQSSSQALTSSRATSASYALTASFATSASQAVSSSYAQTASYVLNAVSSSFATLTQTANTASYVVTAQTASYVLQTVSASFSTLAQTANTASYVVTAQTASYVLQAISSSLASTASYVTGSIFTNTNQALSASFALTASKAPNAALIIFGNYAAGSGFTNPIVTYLPFGTTTVSGTETQRQIVTPQAGTLKNIYIRTNGAAVATSFTTFTIRVNGVATNVKINISGGQAAGLYSNIIDSASVVLGDEISLQVSTSIANGPTVNQYSFGIFNT